MWHGTRSFVAKDAWHKISRLNKHQSTSMLIWEGGGGIPSGEHECLDNRNKPPEWLKLIKTSLPISQGPRRTRVMACCTILPIFPSAGGQELAHLPP
jgi:hypothetical protein